MIVARILLARIPNPRAFPSPLLLLVLALCPPLATAQTTSRAAPVPGSPSAQPSRAEPLDLNLATPAELRALPGMGDVYVRRILDGRPYSAKNQLVTRGILPMPAYNGIRDLVVAHHRPRP